MDGEMELMVSWAILLLKCQLNLEKLDTFMIKTYEFEPCLVVYGTLLLSIEKVTGCSGRFLSVSNNILAGTAMLPLSLASTSSEVIIEV